MTRWAAPGWRRRVLALGLLLGPFGAALLTDLPTCPLASVVGVPCPGCGMTRAALALVRGELGLAWMIHPLVFLVLPISSVSIAAGLWSYVRGPRSSSPAGSLSAPPRGLRAVPGAAGSTPSARSLRAAGTGWLSARWISAVAGVTFALLMALWLARFAGYFGGPVPVESAAQWWSRGHGAPRIAR